MCTRTDVSLLECTTELWCAHIWSCAVLLCQVSSILRARFHKRQHHTSAAIAADEHVRARTARAGPACALLVASDRAAAIDALRPLAARAKCVVVSSLRADVGTDHNDWLRGAVRVCITPTCIRPFRGSGGRRHVGVRINCAGYICTLERSDVTRARMGKIDRDPLLDNLREVACLRSRSNGLLSCIRMRPTLLLTRTTRHVRSF